METLNVRDVLAPMPRHELLKIADRLGLAQTRNLIPEIAGFLADDEAVRGTIEALSPETARILENLSLLLPGLSYDPTASLLQNSSEAIEELLKTGLIGKTRTYWASDMLVMPRESSPIVRAYVLERRAKKLEQSAVDAVERIEARFGTFLRNVSTLLAMSQEKGLVLTKDGEIAKPFLRKTLLPYLEFGEEESVCDRYPADLEEVWSFCKLFELLRFQPNKATLSDLGRAWLNAPEVTIARAIKLHLFIASSVVEPSWIFALLKSDRWVSVTELIAAFTSDLYSEKHRLTVEMEWRSLVARMVRLGILERGAACDRTVIRLGHPWREAAEGVRTRALYVTPDFKISAPRNLDHSIRHEIFRFTALIKADVMDQWEMTRATINAALDAGRTIDRILGFLEDHASVPIPHNVTETLGLWARDHRNVRFFHGPVLILDDPAERRIVRQLAEADGALLDSPSENVFLLHPTKADALVQKIRERRSVGKLRSQEPSKDTGNFEDILKTIEKRFALNGNA